jgi:hypothetical protein
MGTERATAGKLVENAKLLRNPREVVVSREIKFEECHTTREKASLACYKIILIRETVKIFLLDIKDSWIAHPLFVEL